MDLKRNRGIGAVGMALLVGLLMMVMVIAVVVTALAAPVLAVILVLIALFGDGDCCWLSFYYTLINLPSCA